MKILETVRCFICDNDYIKIFYPVHLFLEILFIVLFIFKTITVLWYRSRKYGQIGNTLCVICFHPAKNHLMEVDADMNGCKEPINYFELLFKIKIKAIEPLQLSVCVPCLISCLFCNKGVHQDLMADHNYKPMTNLQYLEWLYNKKGVKNETTESK